MKEIIMKSFIVNGTEYIVQPCTTICYVNLGDENKRQEDVLVSH